MRFWVEPRRRLVRRAGPLGVTKPVRQLIQTLSKQARRRTRPIPFKMMEAGGDLDEALHEDALGALELAPRLLPELVRLEVRATIERRAPRLEAPRPIRHGTLSSPALPGMSLVSATRTRELLPWIHGRRPLGVRGRCKGEGAVKARAL
jgi:hypothetical protein